MLNKIEGAIYSLHTSLSLNPGDPLASQLLSRTLEKYSSSKIDNTLTALELSDISDFSSDEELEKLKNK